jgi:hypothetical protein
MRAAIHNPPLARYCDPLHVESAYLHSGVLQYTLRRSHQYGLSTCLTASR